ncbi:MAG: hypothetical protein FJ117_19420 [Deltaproteobacteria bacterium]|nr:hypothetical protein [Deltaproteobacteria bacterium]
MTEFGVRNAEKRKEGEGLGSEAWKKNIRRYSRETNSVTKLMLWLVIFLPIEPILKVTGQVTG